MISQQQSTILVNNDWPLVIKIPEKMNNVHEVRVHGTLHIGGCILKLINLETSQQTDWSDFALWWPSKKIWLLKTKFTLDQYGLQANDKLFFTQIHKQIRLELPDLQQIELKLNFSISLFHLIQVICKKLGIKHYEELSLLKFDSNYESSSYNTLSGGGKSAALSRLVLNVNSGSNENISISDSSKSVDKTAFEYDPQQLSMSPLVSNIQDKLKLFQKYKSLFDKCRYNN
jgi:kindlin 2